MRVWMRVICLVMAVLLCPAAFISCDQQPMPPVTDSSSDTSDIPDTTEPPAETSETADPSDSETEPADTEDTFDTSDTADTSSDTTEVTDTTEPPVDPNAPEFVNPLTGLAVDSDFTGLRPAAIMVNNIRVSCPQEGVSDADIIYECLVEGGYTRLMMLVMDYPNLAKVGSVRSARHYYLDFAADYDALYVHAGGSEFAYESIFELKVQNLDGVNMYLPSTFARDPDRIKNMGLEHSLMTTGDGIVSGIKYKRYRTTMDADFDFPVDFVPYGTSVSFEDAASHVRIPYSLVQITDFVYDEESGTYLRYQFNGQKHIDGANDEQLAFENVLIYFCETSAISNDPKNRINVGTIGTGTGFYATNGTYIPITWEKESYESPTRFFDADGEPLLLNPGKTFISVCPTTLSKRIDFNYEW